MSVLEARGLRRSYDQRMVVDIDSLVLQESEVFSILGPNGAGKSTLFRLLLGLERPDAGSVRIDALPVASRPARQRMAGVFQRPYLFAGSIGDNLAYGLRGRGLGRSAIGERVSRAAADVGLRQMLDRDPRQLSGGEVQRVALARAIACEPRVLLLDEPSANLDVSAQRAFREDLARVVAARSMSVILITHDPDDAFTLADRVGVMEGGRLVQVGSPLELATNPGNPFVAQFTGAELLLNGTVESTDDGLIGVRLEGGVLLWAAHDGAIANGDVVSVSYHPVEVALSTGRFESSARNVIEAQIERITIAGGLARVALRGQVALASVITRRSAHELNLAVGSHVNAHLKATGIRLFTVRTG